MSEHQKEKRHLNLWELTGSGALLALGAYLVLQGFGYSMGTMRHMGPGFFPVIVGGALALLALGIMLESRYSTEPRPELHWRPMVSVTVGLLTFALLITRLGAIPAIFFLVLITMAGDDTVTWKKRLIVSTAVALLGYVFFGILFRLNISPFWW